MRHGIVSSPQYLVADVCIDASVIRHSFQEGKCWAKERVTPNIGCRLSIVSPHHSVEFYMISPVCRNGRWIFEWTYMLLLKEYMLHVHTIYVLLLRTNINPLHRISITKNSQCIIWNIRICIKCVHSIESGKGCKHFFFCF